jgi:hypothetical protein
VYDTKNNYALIFSKNVAKVLEATLYLASEVNHHYKKTNDNAIKSQYVSETFNTLFKGILMSV